MQPHDGELRGVAVDTAAEILAHAAPGEVLVSRTVADLVAGARIGFVDRGSHTLAAVGAPWQLLATSAHRRGTRRRSRRCSSGARGILDTGLRRDGGPHARRQGLGYLARLLRHPHPSTTSSRLVTGDAPRVNDAAARDDGLAVAAPDAGVVLDEPAKRAYRERIAELEEEAEQARRWNDPERTARAEGELAALTRELAGALGLGGRDRRAASDSERARASVTKAVRGALRRIEGQHPELGRHLALAVRTGTFCSYEPDPRCR